MYQNIYLNPIGGGRYDVHLWDCTKGYNVFQWKKTAFIPDQLGNFTALDGTVCSKSEFFWDAPVKYESDVGPETKLLVELYQDEDEPATWQNRFYFDIEVSMEGQLPDPYTGNNPITSVAYYDETTNKYGVYILDEDHEVTNKHTDEYELIRCGSEEELLIQFIDKWQECAPTIVTGWNIDFFDIPYLYNRIKVVLGKREADRLSPIGIVKWHERRERYFIAGVSCLDYLPIYKNFTFYCWC